MAFFISTTQLPFQKVLPLIIIILLLFVLLPYAHSIHFNFSRFEQSSKIEYIADSFAANGAIELTRNTLQENITQSTGRAIYSAPVHIWDAKTRNLTDFNTQFSFIITGILSTKDYYGDGFTFFLSPNRSTIPPGAAGGNLGIYSDNNSTENQLVAIEFDTFQNPDWDPPSLSLFRHVGININSRVSLNASALKPTNGNLIYKGDALVRYSASTKDLSVFLSMDVNGTSLGFGENPDLSWNVDLRDVLPEWVDVGFSASTGEGVELHQILSWEFNSTLEIIEAGTGGADPPVVNNNGEQPKNEDGKKTGLIAGLVVCGAVLSAGIGGLVLFGLKRKRDRRRKEERVAFDVEMDNEFEKETGPKRFSYKELLLATRNFSEDGKLGEGGFGWVYKGFLGEMNLDVAVKRVSRGSKQGKKEYVSEVKTISRLRHRNLVQLLGWCHERGELLLIYEFMPNGSLDSHLFNEKRLLGWAARYKIATGLASALLYLHEEWEQCVVHRDIKSSNVMLDSNFNAKLGDFGLARLVDHEHGLQTTVVAGTMGYLAPECVTTGKASKESDVYSFGVVALEIACGRRPVEPKAEVGKVMMVEWVWELYGRGLLLDAVDEKLEKEFDEAQIERLMVLGLWCAHPDHNLRPSIKQVIGVLNLEAPLPTLPSKMPVPTYFAPPMNPSFSYGSSDYATNSSRDRSQSSYSNYTTSSIATSSSTSASKALLTEAN
ncbi:L-type lectin-domain-containing protein [Cinnamomum micranthum f. kanehirae]|uniref:L-type lectin-domain-containing protein n=1 Tax=Cinnamomum micranthum f. kanehirae TaxID=337451 RepID=A0A3S3MCP0_9MAGN|nr:L-type lectin-domain-containing protein [Cinnamomum micranthum f. kanehirae]